MKSTASSIAPETRSEKAARLASAKRRATSGSLSASPRNGLPRCRSAAWMNLNSVKTLPRRSGRSYLTVRKRKVEMCAGDVRTRQLHVGLSGVERGEGDGGFARTRTVDPLIKSQLLYHLSYAPGPAGSLAKVIPPVQRAPCLFSRAGFQPQSACMEGLAGR